MSAKLPQPVKWPPKPPKREKTEVRELLLNLLQLMYDGFEIPKDFDESVRLVHHHGYITDTERDKLLSGTLTSQPKNIEP